MQTAQFVETKARAALIKHLTALPQLLQDLDVTLTMQAKTGGMGGGGVAPKERNAFHLGASEVMGRYRALLSRWCTIIDKDLGHFQYVTNPQLMVRKVQAHGPWLATLPECPEWLAELDQLQRDYGRVVDVAPNDRVFAGVCPLEAEDGTVCSTDVYAAPGRPRATCGKCGGNWDVTDWREKALDYAGYRTGTAAQVSRMLSDRVTGEALPQGTIRSWASRGKLKPIGEDHLGTPTYQVRKVRNLWERMKASAYNRKAQAA